MKKPNYSRSKPLAVFLKLMLLLGISFFLWSCFPAISVAENYLILEKGKVKIRRNFIDRFYSDINKKIPLQNLDQIQTAQNTRGKIHLEGKNTIELFSKSVLTISLSTTKADETLLPIGKAIFKIKKRRRKGRRTFRVKTANAIIGVKGTEFLVATGAGETNLLTISGTVTIANITEPEINIDVTKDRVSRIQKSAPPTRPVFVPPAIRKTIVAADSNKAFTDVKFGKTIKASTIRKKKKTKPKVKKKIVPKKKPVLKKKTNEKKPALLTKEKPKSEKKTETAGGKGDGSKPGLQKLGPAGKETDKLESDKGAEAREIKPVEENEGTDDTKNESALDEKEPVDSNPEGDENSSGGTGDEPEGSESDLADDPENDSDVELEEEGTEPEETELPSDFEEDTDVDDGDAFVDDDIDTLVDDVADDVEGVEEDLVEDETETKTIQIKLTN